MQNTKSPLKSAPLRNPSQSLEKENTILKELTNASILLALVTSLLYISGATYINSYLAEWGVESSLIISNTQKVLVQGVGILFVGGIYVIILAVIIVILLLLPYYMVLDISKSPLARKIFSKIYKAFKYKDREVLEPPPILQSIARLSSQFIVLLSFLLVFFLIFYQLLKLASSQAEITANKDYTEFSSGKITNDKIFTRKKLINISGEEKEGYILANSNSLVVLYFPESEGKEEQVVIVPLSSVSNIESIKNHNITTETK